MTKKAWLILLIDFNKAFDSIDHKFLENTLNIFVFGENMINWIKTFFSSREAYLMVNGYMSSTFKLQQGFPQGDVVSPYIFLLMVEILLIKITKTKNNMQNMRIEPQVLLMTVPSSSKGLKKF